MLGIETCTLPGEVALASESGTVASFALPAGQKPTASLVPVIQQLCQKVGWELRDLTLVGVDIGPGSFTGVRVGLTCAKVIAFATGAPLATARSLDVIARNATWNGPIEVAIDAARSQVFACKYQPAPTQWAPCSPPRIVNATEWAESLTPQTLATGPALTKYRSIIPPYVTIADESTWWPRASTVLEIGLSQAQQQLPFNFFTLEPLYLRPSAAEEKLSEMKIHHRNGPS
jgi:tRNA threonylcarbamoyladenosine biosynthesis protein TsaB